MPDTEDTPHQRRSIRRLGDNLIAAAWLFAFWFLLETLFLLLDWSNTLWSSAW